MLSVNVRYSFFIHSLDFQKMRPINITAIKKRKFRNQVPRIVDAAINLSTVNALKKRAGAA